MSGIKTQFKNGCQSIGLFRPGAKFRTVGNLLHIFTKKLICHSIRDVKILKVLKLFWSQAEIIKVGVVTIDMLSIGIKFENFMQAGFRDQGLHCGRTCTTESPLFCPNWYSFL